MFSVCASVLLEHFHLILTKRDNIDNRDNLGHYNHDMKFSYRSTPSHNEER